MALRCVLCKHDGLQHCESLGGKQSRGGIECEGAVPAEGTGKDCWKKQGAPEESQQGSRVIFSTVERTVLAIQVLLHPYGGSSRVMCGKSVC